MTNLDRGYGRPEREPSPGDHNGRAPGKRTLTMALPPRAEPVQLRAGDAVQSATAPVSPGDDPFGLHLLAAEGLAGASEPLPHRDAIQASFGRHDVSEIAAHVGGPAAAAAGDMGAEAYATGSHVAFRGHPDLHTAAHEAAHVVQQRGGVQLLGGVGEVGDVHERGADEVADRVVGGESAEALLDTMAGGAGASGAPQVQHKKGDFARLSKPSRPPTFMARFKGDVYKASFLEGKVRLQRELDEPIELEEETIESEVFELVDVAVPVNEEAELRVQGNKKLDAIDVFKALVDGKGEVTEEHLELVKAAHKAGDAISFVTAQQAYQNLLVSTFGLSLGEIMNVHRSAGYEYEFGRFMDPQRPGVSTEPELLRSHVTLALSPTFSPLFEGRAAQFRLETDSRNCLELVTPPFLCLIAGNTGEQLTAIHKLFEQTTLTLGKSMQVAEPEKLKVNEEEDELKQQQEHKKKYEFGVPISEQLATFGKLVCPGEWTWQGDKDTTRRFCFTFQHAKHVGKAYGQANVSMTPEEILQTAALLPEWNQEEAKSGLSFSAQVAKSVPTKLADEICLLMMKPVKVDDGRLRGAITLYARNTSNLAGIPSIMYRRTSGERPDEGNLATEIKETLLLWVKDFPHTVIADGLIGTKLAEPFIGALLDTAEAVWNLVEEALTGNCKLLEQETQIKVEKFSKFDFIQEFAKGLQLEQKEKTKVLLSLKNKQHEMQTTLIEGAKAARLAIEMAQVEYSNMVKLHASALKGAVYDKKHTKEENEEEFGEGYGVRKDTYLDRSPGDRRLRVAEIRDTSHLERLEKQVL